MHVRLLLSVGLIVAAGLAGCAKPEAHHEHQAGEHVHVAPHGGTLVGLGEHAFNLELVRDRDAGKITAYVLDAHAENFIRIPAAELPLVATIGGQRQSFPLRAVANTMTGETVGNTSQFEADAAWAKQPAEVRGEVGPVEIRGGKFGPAGFVLK